MGLLSTLTGGGPRVMCVQPSGVVIAFGLGEEVEMEPGLPRRREVCGILRV